MPLCGTALGSVGSLNNVTAWGTPFSQLYQKQQHLTERRSNEQHAFSL